MDNSSLTQNTVVIWQAYLPDFYDQLADLRALLNAAELKKADRFHFEKHQKRFAVSQSILRKLLGHYTNQDPNLIEFSKGRYGKPFLNHSRVKFNVTHSYEYAMYAFTLDDEVGIDLEHWRERKHLDGIIDSNFSELEQRLYHQLPDELKIAGFYQGWTCNESFIKAIGMGLSFPLKDFSVEMDPRKALKLLNAEPQQNIDTDWHLHSISCPKDYSAALATKDMKISTCYFLEKPFYSMDH